MPGKQLKCEETQRLQRNTNRYLPDSYPVREKFLVLLKINEIHLEKSLGYKNTLYTHNLPVTIFRAEATPHHFLLQAFIILNRSVKYFILFNYVIQYL
jgi:hypothetical protein